MSMPSRRFSSTLTGYDALEKCKLALEHTKVPAELVLSQEVRDLATTSAVEATCDPEVAATCRRELSRLEEERRLEEEEREARLRARKEAEARRERERAEAEAERAREAAAEERRQRQARIDQAREAMERRHAEERAHVEEARRAADARRRAQLDEDSRRDEAIAHSLAADQNTDKIARLQALTAADPQTCQFYLDCAGNDVGQAFLLWEQTSS